MENILVSVIIPVCNGERFVGRTIASAIGQTYYPLEIVVVDDGSTDHTPDIVNAAVARDSRIRLFRGPNSGMSAARNLAISESRGALIAPLDADDLWHPEKIARQAAVMRASSSEVGVVYCWTVDIDEDDILILPVRDKCAVEGNVVVELVARNNFLECGSVPLIRRSCLDTIGGYDTSLRNSADWKLNLALAEICHFASVPSHLVGYRRSRTNNSNNIVAMERSSDQVVRWITEKWPDLSPNIKRRMSYNLNYFLAHRALTMNDFIGAARYYFRSVRADPSASFAPLNLSLALRFAARSLGIKRRIIPFQPTAVSFKDFQPRLEADVETLDLFRQEATPIKGPL
jgi:glycosyltransferase involved in cell wall biosynthesis